MDSPAVIYALRWLIHDTFRQTITSRVFWIMLALSGLCIVFCLGVRIEGGAVRDDDGGKELFDANGKPLTGQKTGRLTLLFGAMPVDFRNEAKDQAQFLLGVFASRVAGLGGILMALIWTAGFIPEALQPSAAAVLLAKPVPRWLFLLGKYLGVVCFVALQVAVFFLGTWIALGLRTGFWPIEYLLGIPLMIFNFATIFSFTVFVAVVTRSTMACVVGGVLFWLICVAVNHGRHFAVVFPELNDGYELPGFTVFLAEAGYWLLPKPVDLTIMMENALNLGANMMTLKDQKHIGLVLDKDLFFPIASILSSCLCPVFLMWAAASQLSQTDY